jgi:hypothetical protein
MAIDELWIPSPNYGTANPQKLKGAIHTTQGAETIQALGNWFANPSAQCSSHHGADNYTTTFGAYVYEDDTAWTQGGMNGVCLSIELCGYAEWSRETWLNSKLLLTQNASRWVRYISDKYSIPMIWLNDSQAQDSWTKGFCDHDAFKGKGSGHWDCGDGFPYDVVMEWAKDAATPIPGSGNEMTPAVTFWQDEIYQAMVWSDGRVCYAGPDTDNAFVAVDPNSNAKGGVSIAISSPGEVVISYINQANAVCHYRRAPNGGSFQWIKIGGNAA